MNIIQNKIEVYDILKKLNSNALTLEQKFLLIILRADELSDFPQLKVKRASAIRDIEKEFTRDLTIFKKNPHNEQHQSFRKILQAVEELEKLEFTNNIDHKTEILDALKAELNKDRLEYTDETLSNIEKLLDQISLLQPENYLFAHGLSEIGKIQGQHELNLSVNGIIYTIEECQQIVDIEIDKQEQLLIIRNELCTYKYALYSCINEEILFAAGFIDQNLFEHKAPTVFKYLNKRKRLYWDIKKYIDSTNYNILYFTHLSYSTGNEQTNETSLLYFRLRKLIHCYFFLCKKAPGSPTLYQKIEDHLNNILEISAETDLLNPEITTMYSDNVAKILDKLNIKQKDVASLLGISDSYLSQELNKDIPSYKYLQKIAQLYNCSLYFLQEKTTIPSYGKSSTNSYIWLMSARRNVGNNFLDILYEVFNQDRDINNSLYKTPEQEKEHFDAVLDHINFLRKEYIKLSVPSLKATTTLLKQSLKR
jgi:transcriptional regulator with XRE-family HTH domain